MDKTVSNTRVLHIDDDFDFRGSFKSTVKREGIVVLERRDSQEAVGLLPGQDFDVLVVDSSGFDFAQQLRCKSKDATLIVLSINPDKADFPSDAAISKGDIAWPKKVLESINEPIPPMVKRSQKAFERDLPELLKNRYRQWVAYHGEKQIGFSRSQTALYAQCQKLRLKDDEFVVRSIEPILADEDLVFPADS